MTRDDFKPGDLALVVRATLEFCRYIGTECVVTEYLEGELRQFGDYAVQMSDGAMFAATRRCLQKVPPHPAKPVAMGSWNLVPGADRIRAPQRARQAPEVV